MIDSFSDDWDTFASDWVLGDVPVLHREKVRIALKTIQEHRPDKVQEHLAGQRRGLGPMGDLVCDGLLIRACKDIPGFVPVFTRFCNEDKSAESQLRVCAELAAMCVLQEIEPLRHRRRPDAVCEIGGANVWVEVMCPEQSDLTDATYNDMQDLVELLMPCAEWRSIEVKVVGTLMHRSFPSSSMQRSKRHSMRWSNSKTEMRYVLQHMTPIQSSIRCWPMDHNSLSQVRFSADRYQLE